MKIPLVHAVLSVVATSSSTTGLQMVAMDEYQRIYNSEIHEHFYDSPASSASEQWAAALDYEWKSAWTIEHEATSYRQVPRDIWEPMEDDDDADSDHGSLKKDLATRSLLRQTTIERKQRTVLEDPEDSTVDDGMTPFLVCDHDPGSGGDAYRMVSDMFDATSVIHATNQDGLVCYVLPAYASVAAVSNSESMFLSATPLIAEMKVEEGTSSAIQEGEDDPHGLTGVFCPGAVSAMAGRSDPDDLLNVILTSITKDDTDSVGPLGRRFLRSNETRHPDAHEKWERLLRRTMADDYCANMVDAMVATSDSNGIYFDVSYPHDMNDSQEKRDCLLTATMALAAHPSICRVGAHPIVKTQNENERSIAQSGVAGWTPFYDVGLNGTGQIVAISDTGLDQGHCAFSDSQQPLPGQTTLHANHAKRKVVQYMYNPNGGDANDLMDGHGTHVAATAVGRQEGGGPVDGAAPGGKVAFFDLSNPSDGEKMFIPNGIEGTFLQSGYSAGARVHSASWGGGTNMLGLATARFDRFMKINDDMLLVVANGNNGINGFGTALGFPAGTKNGLSVGAARNWGEQETVVGFSSYGPTYDGRIKPDIVATGVAVTSARAQSGCELSSKTGTSMGAPLVSGMALLVRQYFVDGFYPGGFKGSSSTNTFSNPSAALVKAVLMIGSRKMGSAEYAKYGTDYYDFFQGFGHVALLHSLPIRGITNYQNRIYDRVPLREGEEHSYWVQIDDGGGGGCSYGDELRVMMVYTDEPNTMGCSQDCVLNHVDMYVIPATYGDDTNENNNVVYRPNGLTDRPDTKNVAERVIIERPQHGDLYEIRVKGTDFVEAGMIQEYALVINGCLAAPDTTLDGTYYGSTPPKATNVGFSPTPPAAANDDNLTNAQLFSVRTSKQMYYEGEPIVIEYDANGKLHHQDFIGIWQGDLTTTSTSGSSTTPLLFKYRYTCGLNGKVCDRNKLVFDGQADDFIFRTYKNTQVGWPLPLGTYTIAYHRENRISNIGATVTFQVLAPLPSSIKVCQDDDTFRFVANNGQERDCSWITWQWQRKKYCTSTEPKHQEIGKACDRACHLCWE